MEQKVPRALLSTKVIQKDKKTEKGGMYLTSYSKLGYFVEILNSSGV